MLQEELPEFVKALVNNNLIVSAFHNHWNFTNPTILYVHFQSVESPSSFEHKFVKASHVLNN
ncbi:DUF1259 domain-containing protein [Psychrobacillus glaciei]|uniref:DUF1259 domain-containing protein n=1 Tax=Psychrobacillus glaciei TaxID=2283160 RepID=UPI001CEF779A|nr:DUF1259 domain-containing protein [Psychrobacillus glaciei]